MKIECVSYNILLNKNLRVTTEHAGGRAQTSARRLFISGMNT